MLSIFRVSIVLYFIKILSGSRNFHLGQYILCKECEDRMNMVLKNGNVGRLLRHLKVYLFQYFQYGWQRDRGNIYKKLQLALRGTAGRFVRSMCQIWHAIPGVRE